MTPSAYAFASGVEAGHRALLALCEAGLAPALVIGYDASLSDRSGYVSLRPTAVRFGVPVIETADINADGVRAMLKETRVDLLVVAGWSQIVKADVLRGLRLGGIGLHPSRLPTGRGRAAIPWTLIKGMTKTGVTVFRLEPTVDAGAIIGIHDIEVSRRDDAATLYDRVSDAHASLLLEHLPAVLAGDVTEIAQEVLDVPWPKRSPEDGRIDWSRDAAALYDWVRALTRPYPGAFTEINDRRLLVWTADMLGWPTAPQLAPGTILGPVWSTSAGGVGVQTADGVLIVREVELDGAPPGDALELIEQGFIVPGERLG